MDLEFIQLGPTGQPRTFRANFHGLRQIIQDREFDVLHAYEFRACMEAWAALGIRRRPALLCTDMSMRVHKRFPRTVPLIVGTRSLGIEAEQLGVKRVFTIEPPVDVDDNHPSLDGRRFVDEHQLGSADLKIVMVSRLTRHLKLEGIARTIDAVPALTSRFPIRLVIVGDGECFTELEERARQVNRDVGREVVVLTGAMIDPRPAYASADVVVGMGHSVLRAMAFGKPVVVVGQGGYSEIVSPASIDHFRMVGFYSVGSDGDPQRRLNRQLAELLDDAERRRQLGAFGRAVAVTEFSLSAAASMLDATYRQVAVKRSLDGAWLSDTRNLLITVASGKAKLYRSRMPWNATRRVAG